MQACRTFARRRFDFGKPCALTALLVALSGCATTATHRAIAPAPTLSTVATSTSSQPADSEIQPVAFLAEQSPAKGEQVRPPAPPAEIESPLDLPPPPIETYPIDLMTALHLADGSNLQIAVAREQIRQAWARADASRALWLPSIRAGMNFNKHEGPIQDIRGSVFPVSRGAAFSGLGAGTFGAGSPMVPGIYANFHLADAWFQPLAARQAAYARRHAAAATANDVLLNVSLGYLDLQRATEELAIADEARDNAKQLAELTMTFARSGEGLASDADRAAADLALRENDVLRARESQRVASARLAQSLRLDATVQLSPLSELLIPIELLAPELPEGELLAMALSTRPEIGENRHLVDQAVVRMRRERFAVLMPSVLLGASYGAFGGGVNQTLDGFGGRFDADAVAYWELRNLGFGDVAARAETRSLVRQANAKQLAMMDQVAREVVEAYAQVTARRAQIETAHRGIAAAQSSHERNLARIRDLQGLPIEAQQSIHALALARRDYLRALIDYNSAQFTLYRAIGWPGKLPAALVCEPAQEQLTDVSMN